MDRRRFLITAPAFATLGSRIWNATPAAAAPITQSDLDTAIAEVDPGKVPGAVVIATFEPDGSSAFSSLGAHPEDAAPAITDAFQVGSITKVFTSALVLTLVDEGQLALDDTAAEVVPGYTFDPAVTIRQLLNHTSGIPNYTDASNLVSAAREDLARVWTPAEILEFTADLEPGTIGEHAYSNTNYILLGMLIESLAEAPFHEVLRATMLDPLELSSTHLGGHETGTAPVGAYQLASGGWQPMDPEYTSWSTLAWAAGGLVSTGGDLHTFLTALFAGDLISEASLAEMMDTGPDDYGLGLMSTSDVPGVYGHEGGIPGYHTLVAHGPETGRTAFWATTNEAIDFFPSVMPIFERLAIE